MTSIDTRPAFDAPTAWPSISLNHVTTDDVGASLNGGRPTIYFGCVHINPGRMPQVDIYEDLDELDRLLDKAKAEVARLRSMVKSTEPLTSSARQGGQP